jgi:glycosyltransferase involved in cell wall biosynthesis
MKLLHVMPTMNPASGGPIENVRQIVPVLAQAGHENEVVTLDAPDAPWLRELPFATHAMGPSWGKYGYTPRLVPWMRENATRYDCAIIRGIWQYHSFGSWHAIRGRMPYVVFINGMLAPWFKRTYPLKHVKKWLYWPWTDYRVVRDAKAVLFTCEEERVAARQSFWLYRCNERVVSYGTAAPAGDADDQRQAFFTRFPHLEGKQILLFMGRLHPIKGCDILIEAFARLAQGSPEQHLVMAGPDENGWKKDLAALAARLGVSDRITWTGIVTGDMKWGAYRAAELVAVPSHHENFGVVVAEALACGVPVLLSNKVNIWREVNAMNAGLICNDEVGEVSETLARWSAMPETAKETMRRNAQQCFARHFNIEDAATSLIEVCRPPATLAGAAAQTGG